MLSAVIAVAVAIAVIALVTTVALLRRPRRRALPFTPRHRVMEPGTGTVAEPGARTVTEPGARTVTESGARTVTEPAAPAVQEPGAPALQEPAPLGLHAPPGAAPADPGTAAPVAPAPPAVPAERPAPVAGRLVRLRSRLARSQNVLGRGLLTLLSRDVLDDEVWEEVEDTLLSADVGVAASRRIVDGLRERTRVLGTRTAADVRLLLRSELLAVIGRADRALRTLPHPDHPAVLLVVGVNGTGKTTTCAKLARVLVADGRSVLLGAADTFRAAAADQLETWGARVGAHTVRGAEGADPASVAFEAVRAGVEQRVDAVVIDTAGRLHTKAALMDELRKIRRVLERQGPVDDVLLVLDATTGQNGVVQAKVFTEAVDVTGIVLTKLDGTAKGGIVVAVQQELGVPVKLVGLGEGPDDLAPFEPEAFVDALLGEPSEKAA